MNPPWLLEEAGPNARWALITIAPSCVAGHGELAAPTAVVHQTRAIRIRVFARHPKPGQIGEANCGGHWGLAVHLPEPIDGREIEGQSWPSDLHYGELRG
jgi:hypothetical protein